MELCVLCQHGGELADFGLSILQTLFDWKIVGGRGGGLQGLGTEKIRLLLKMFLIVCRGVA